MPACKTVAPVLALASLPGVPAGAPSDNVLRRAGVLLPWPGAVADEREQRQLRRPLAGHGHRLHRLPQRHRELRAKRRTASEQQTPARGPNPSHVRVCVCVCVCVCEETDREQDTICRPGATRQHMCGCDGVQARV